MMRSFRRTYQTNLFLYLSSVVSRGGLVAVTNVFNKQLGFFLLNYPQMTLKIADDTFRLGGSGQFVLHISIQLGECLILVQAE